MTATTECFLKIIATLSASLFLAAQAPAPVTVTIENSPGGFIHLFVAKRFAFERAGTQVHIKGMCASACTIYTGMTNVCVEPGAYFKFHQGWERPPNYAGYATNYMLGAMNPHFRQALIESGEPLPTFLSGDYLIIEGDEAVANGWMRACNG